MRFQRVRLTSLQEPGRFTSQVVLARRWLLIVKGVLTKPGLTVGGLIVVAFAVIAIAAPWITPPEGESPYLLPRDGLGSLPKPPGPGHPLGTMSGQYDVFYGLVWGTRVAFRIGLLITLGRALIGVLLGLISGYYGGLLDALLMRITDAFMAFPVVAIVMVMVALFREPLWLAPMGSRIEQIIILSLALFGWMPYARLMRGNVLAERGKQYIEAALSVGALNRRILFRHLLPNVTQGLFVLIASDIGAMTVLVAAFSFIGLTGGLNPRADWGEMLSSARNWVIGTRGRPFEYWYTYLPVSLCIVLFAVGWNLIGDGLRDVLDPRLR